MPDLLIARDDIQDPKTGEIVYLAGDVILPADWSAALEACERFNIDPADVLEIRNEERGERYRLRFEVPHA